MSIYVAVTAILNLALGYALAVYMGAGRVQLATTTGDLSDESDNFDSAADV